MMVWEKKVVVVGLLIQTEQSEGQIKWIHNHKSGIPRSI